MAVRAGGRGGEQGEEVSFSVRLCVVRHGKCFDFAPLFRQHRYLLIVPFRFVD